MLTPTSLICKSAMDQRIQRARERYLVLKSQQDSLESRKESLATEIENLESEVDILMKVSELFKHLLDQIIVDNLAAITSLVSDGLGNIFHDQNLGFKAEVVHRRDQVCVDLYSTNTTPNGGVVEAPALSSFGGGVSAVESLLLRVIVIMRNNLAKVMFLDESLAAVSESYIEPLGLFLQSLVRTTGMNILLVTHKASIVQYADTAYRAELGPTTKSMKLRKL